MKSNRMRGDGSELKWETKEGHYVRRWQFSLPRCPNSRTRHPGDTKYKDCARCDGSVLLRATLVLLIRKLLIDRSIDDVTPHLVAHLERGRRAGLRHHILIGRRESHRIAHQHVHERHLLQLLINYPSVQCSTKIFQLTLNHDNQG